MKPLARWTIGKTSKDGYECLIESINSFLKYYQADVFICYNCELDQLPQQVKKFNLVEQQKNINGMPEAAGVAWKLYPPRLDSKRHEISIDNDIILTDRIEQIDDFLEKDNFTLLLEDLGRTYGRFENHVPPKFCINSGVYGMPPNFDFEKYIKFYVGEKWEKNALYEHDKNETFDEQGLVALALLDNKNYIIIPKESITNCEYTLCEGKGYHFIGLNRTKNHEAFNIFKNKKRKIHL